MIQFLAQDLATFLAANPHVRIELEDALSDRTIHALENGQADTQEFDYVALDQGSLSMTPQAAANASRLVFAG